MCASPSSVSPTGSEALYIPLPPPRPPLRTSERRYTWYGCISLLTTDISIHCGSSGDYTLTVATRGKTIKACGRAHSRSGSRQGRDNGQALKEQEAAGEAPAKSPSSDDRLRLVSVSRTAHSTASRQRWSALSRRSIPARLRASRSSHALSKVSLFHSAEPAHTHIHAVDA
jgi:hypothetical protein